MLQHSHRAGCQLCSSVHLSNPTDTFAHLWGENAAAVCISQHPIMRPFARRLGRIVVLLPGFLWWCASPHALCPCVCVVVGCVLYSNPVSAVTVCVCAHVL